MTMRGLFTLVFTLQMGFGDFAFAQVPPPPGDNDPTSGMRAAGAPPPPPGSSSPSGTAEVPRVSHLPKLNCDDKIRCSDFLYSFYYDKEGNPIADDTGRKVIEERLRTHRGEGCDTLANHDFLQRLLKIWDAKTEARTTGFDCPECRDTYHQLIMEMSADKANGKLPGEVRAIFRSAACAPGVTKKVAAAPPPAAPAPAPEPAVPEPPRVQAAPPANVDAPAETYRGRQSSYGQREAPPPPPPEPVNTGGGGGFFNSNTLLSFGVGALVGGLIGYRIGQNSAYQSMYNTMYNPYGMPGWQQMMPRPFMPQPPPMYGGLLGARPGLPAMYPVGAPGAPGAFNFGGAPTYAPYNYGGVGGGMPGYYGGFNSVAPGNIFNTGTFGSTMYNNGAAPVYMPYIGH